VNKIIKRILIGIGVVIAVIISCLIYFVVGSLSDKDEEELVKKQAAQYLKTNPDYKGRDFEIYGTVYDNMGNFGVIEYAAKVRDKDTGEEFMVYNNENTDKMQDTKTVENTERLVEKEIGPKIISYVEEKFGKITNASVGYSTDTDQTIVMFLLPRDKEQQDKERFNELVTFIQKEVGLQHTSVTMGFNEKDNNAFNIEF
jgi:hypothetical protein